MAEQSGQIISLSNSKIKIKVSPENLGITATDEKGKQYVISSPSARQTAHLLQQDETHLSWTFGKGITVFLKLQEDYVDLDIKSADTAHLVWPKVESVISAFTIPLHQGKYIPAGDEKWKAHFVKNPLVSGSQDLSMQFFAVNFTEKALVYVIKNMFNNELKFYTHEGILAAQFKHEFPATVKDKQFGFRIYLVDNDPVAIAKTYKKYVDERSPVLTLEDKAADNPNIRKLYGAPHIYIWNNQFLVADDVKNWKLLKDKIVKESASGSINPTKHILKLFGLKDAEAGKEFLAQFNEFSRNNYISRYHKNLFLRALNEALSKKDFYNVTAWKGIVADKQTIALLDKRNTPGDGNGATELYQLNKQLLNNAYTGCLQPVQDWGGAPLALLDEMQAAGIKTAWLGLNDWVSGEIHPDFVLKAREKGYLIGPYDSYHSIHPPGKEVWLTAKFEDTSLYNKAYVMNKNGKPAHAFLGQGRQLSPVLAMPAVKQRMSAVMKDFAHEFNSWFIDCDGTGEILDDYTPGRMTSQEQDLEARIRRMNWIRDQYKLVIGTEVGNDFVANTIAFGHGMTTPVIAWNDPDMRKNKTSEYYIGAYYSSDGGVPGRYGLQAPMKDEYLYLYFDNRFNIPLFQLVYNNSVITSHHWECGSLKIPGEIKNTELKEVLYNVPPMYHLNQSEWIKYKEIISRHMKIFSRTHELAVKLEMTDFKWLTKDRLVQRTAFGQTMEVIANFSKASFTYQSKIIPANDLLIHNLLTDQYELYNP
ncbi:glycoside hydrolase [Pedobacter lusitanus]|uniref:glycoside hydrolase n=1 Tax=Pedobacter lusitanus TaxID=1503925 RepID=UPI000698BFD0|nr:glycoside hydrolase [Pedobacter lusitanus]